MIRLAFAQGFAQVGFHAWIATLPVAMAMAGRPDGEIGAVVGAAAIFNLLAALSRAAWSTGSAVAPSTWSGPPATWPPRRRWRSA